MKKGLLIILSGPSGVGKGTVRKYIMKRNAVPLVFSISMTTRLPRATETNGVEYYFVSKEEFNNLSVGGENLIHESDTYDYEGKYFFVAGLKLSGRNGVLKLRKSATDEKTLTMKVGGY